MDYQNKKKKTTNDDDDVSKFKLSAEILRPHFGEEFGFKIRFQSWFCFECSCCTRHEQCDQMLE